jgi:hypothetical protein
MIDESEVASIDSTRCPALGLVTTVAQAGPSGLAGAFDQSAGRSGLAEKVTWYGDGYKGNKGYYGHYQPYEGRQRFETDRPTPIAPARPKTGSR